MIIFDTFLWVVAVRVGCFLFEMLFLIGFWADESTMLMITECICAVSLLCALLFQVSFYACWEVVKVTVFLLVPFCGGMLVGMGGVVVSACMLPKMLFMHGVWAIGSTMMMIIDGICGLTV